jgi:hypothetical protein
MQGVGGLVAGKTGIGEMPWEGSNPLEPISDKVNRSSISIFFNYLWEKRHYFYLGFGAVLLSLSIATGDFTVGCFAIYCFVMVFWGFQAAASARLADEEIQSKLKSKFEAFGSFLDQIPCSKEELDYAAAKKFYEGNTEDKGIKNYVTDIDIACKNCQTSKLRKLMDSKAYQGSFSDLERFRNRIEENRSSPSVERTQGQYRDTVIMLVGWLKRDIDTARKLFPAIVKKIKEE